MLDSKKRFTKTVKYYDRYRPSYPQSLVNWILKTTNLKPGSTIVDIGCGTGISTRLFSNSSFKVIGIDPNPDMLRVARKQGGATYQVGEAANTGLPAHTADLITMAQALHWFDVKSTLKEFRKILKPNSWCCAFWNKRHPKTKFIQAYDSLINSFSQDYAKIAKPDVNAALIKTSPQVKTFKPAIFTNSQTFDLDSLIGRAYSTSYIAHGVKDHLAFKRQLTQLFNHFKRHGKVTFYYHTPAICWQII